MRIAAPFAASPAVANVVVYVGADVGGGPNLFALGAASGTRLWSFTAAAPVQSLPTIANGVVYTGPDPFTNTLYAFRLPPSDRRRQHA